MGLRRNNKTSFIKKVNKKVTSEKVRKALAQNKTDGLTSEEIKQAFNELGIEKSNTGRNLLIGGVVVLTCAVGGITYAMSGEDNIPDLNEPSKNVHVQTKEERQEIEDAKNQMLQNISQAKANLDDKSQGDGPLVVERKISKHPLNDKRKPVEPEKNSNVKPGNLNTMAQVGTKRFKFLSAEFDGKLIKGKIEKTTKRGETKVVDFTAKKLNDGSYGVTIFSSSGRVINGARTTDSNLVNKFDALINNNAKEPKLSKDEQFMSDLTKALNNGAKAQKVSQFGKKFILITKKDGSMIAMQYQNHLSTRKKATFHVTEGKDLNEIIMKFLGNQKDSYDVNPSSVPDEIKSLVDTFKQK